jgi:diguanylate cyclase (GGDEF)-like protein
MSSPQGVTGVRRLGVATLSLVLLCAGLSLTWAAAPLWTDKHLPYMLPWWALAPAYLVAYQLRLEYEFRKQARVFHLTHIPLILGIVFVAPWLHLGARLLATVTDCIVQRQRPLKATFNAALSCFEVAVAITVLSWLQPSPDAGPELWAVVLTSLMLSELVSFFAMQILLSLVGVRQSLSDRVSTLGSSMAISLVFSGLAIVFVAAVWTDPLTLIVIGAVATALIIAFRGHRRLAQQQQQTAELHQFVKGLGPLDLDRGESRQVLDHVRELLRAHVLELSLQTRTGWRRVRLTEAGSDGEKSYEDTLEDASAISTTPSTAVLRSADHMMTPLVGSNGLMGVLTVQDRMSEMRPFGIRDLRLLETLGVELASALERGQLQHDLALAATTDALTQLPNLNEICRQIDDGFREGRRELVLAAIAVDSFREVNDALGHEVGDELLLEVTRRIRLSYADALVGRIGGGRFALVVPADTVGHDPSMFGLGIRAQVEGGAQLGPVGTHIRLSVGCVAAPEHGEDAATLIRRAETAMYGARNAHGGPVVWEPVYEVEGQRRLAVVMALREALSSGAIGVAFQPKLDATNLQVTGVEALARWTHPALGAISPGEFVPLAEAAGLMGPLTSSVLRQALTACKGWQRRAGRVGVAVNVSADTILDPTFVTEVAAILTSINISPDLLTLELTEGVVVNDPLLAKQRLGEMRGLGVKISVDDFGTGYSSLTYLKGLPVDEVKIDKGFVDEIAHDAADRAVVRAVVDIAHTMGLRVVAEGVERADQGELLAQLGVDELQGYLHARPMAALDMAQWLRKRDDAGSQSYADPL